MPTKQCSWLVLRSSRCKPLFNSLTLLDCPPSPHQQQPPVPPLADFRTYTHDDDDGISAAMHGRALPGSDAGRRPPITRADGQNLIIASINDQQSLLGNYE